MLLEFGTGKVDFRAVFTEMKKAGFNGPTCMVECVAPSDTAASGDRKCSEKSRVSGEAFREFVIEGRRVRTRTNFALDVG